MLPRLHAAHVQDRIEEGVEGNREDFHEVGVEKVGVVELQQEGGVSGTPVCQHHDPVDKSGYVEHYVEQV